jgi:glutamate dehydrogenase/leucine dehydrogenase
MSCDFREKRAFLECSNIRSAPSTTDAHVGEQVEGIDIRQDMQAEPSFIVLVEVFVVAGNWIEGNVCAIDGLGNAGKTAPGCESISARLYVARIRRDVV